MQWIWIELLLIIGVSRLWRLMLSHEDKWSNQNKPLTIDEKYTLLINLLHRVHITIDSNWTHNFSGGRHWCKSLYHMISVRKYRRSNQIWTIQRNWHHMVNKTNKKKQKNSNRICVWHWYAQVNTNNVNKTWALLQTAGGKDEPNIVFMWKS